MALTFDFTGIRIQDSSLTSVDWELNIDLAATAKSGKSQEDLEYNASVAYQKIYFWLETNLPNVIVVDVGNEDDLYIANLSSNIMLYCPDIPNDDMIIQLLHSKISVLAGKDLIVGEMKLKGSDTTLQYTFDCAPDEYILPSTVAEYYTEGTARDEKPWWTRDDGFCFEFIRPADTKIQDDELFKDITDPLDEFRKWIRDSTDVHIGLSKEPAKIVQVERWKPKTI
jgi:hypothetical protein